MTKKLPYAEDKRRHLILFFFGICAVLIGWRLFDLSVLNKDKYVEKGVNQRVIQEELRGERGSILDRNGDQLAISFPQPYIYIDPSSAGNGVEKVEKSQILAAHLDLIGVDETEEAKMILTKFNSPTSFEYLVRNADPETADVIRDLKLGGVHIGYEPRRFHVSGDQLAKGVLGSVNVDNVGMSGLESQYEEKLKGVIGLQITELSADGSTIPTKAGVLKEASQGSDLILTIDRTLQGQVERELAKTIQESEAKGGIVIIQQPSTGEILAMASMVMTETGEVRSTSHNPAVTLSYEPASVMKAMTFAGVINEGIADASTRKDIPDTVIEEWEDFEGEIRTEKWRDEFEYGIQEMGVQDILTHSSNTGTIVWGQELGKERLYSYLTNFGFGQTTDLGFPGESQGILHPLETWSAIDLNTISIGHGISVSPIQLVTAYSAIANDGVYVAPKLVTHVVDSDGIKDYVSAIPSRRVISASTSRQIATLLTSVVDNGTGEKAKVSGYKIAAKTGTSWKYFDPENSYELPNGQFNPYLDKQGLRHYTSTVTGFYPALNPQFSMLVIIDDPAPVEEQFYASHVSAPLFGQLASWSLRHYQVSPVSELLVSELAGQEISPEGNQVVAETNEVVQ
ncbi:MAG: hypothetical protein CBC37_02435 [Acidimicrobiaceae bacterium TMED77]|nr:penicillin-binding protein 2 [Acidimicrobiales bacterium]OUV01335.1 MAG: hypothetical protein CBC37_02435 [Acidimicrobiaceae bacterium TMED77]